MHEDRLMENPLRREVLADPTAVTINWGDPGGWSSFTAHNVTWDAENVLCVDNDAGEGVVTAKLSGQGDPENVRNDRRWLLLDGVAEALDSEMLSLWDPARTGPPGQVGHVHRAVEMGTGEQKAVVVWSNVIYGAWGTVLVAVWEGTDGVARFGTDGAPQRHRDFTPVLGGGSVPEGPYWVRSSLVGSRITVKVWARNAPEPADSAADHTLVVSYPPGALPSGPGKNGLLIAHLGGTSSVGVGPVVLTRPIQATTHR